MEFDMKKQVRVTNRTAGWVVYQIPEHGILRQFSVNETKTVPYEELVWLSYQPGGKKIMQDMLLIQDMGALDSLNVHTEPEYFMTETDVVNLLQKGSLDELLDALDFAPEGIIQLIKDKAVSLPLYDMQKREAILKATGYNVTAAIENAKPDEDEEKVEAPAATRRVQKQAVTPEAPARRTEGKYKIVAPIEE